MASPHSSVPQENTHLLTSVGTKMPQKPFDDEMPEGDDEVPQEVLQEMPTLSFYAEEEDKDEEEEASNGEDVHSDSESDGTSDAEQPRPEPGMMSRSGIKSRMENMMSAVNSRGQSRWGSTLGSQWDDDEEHEDVDDRPWIKKWWRGEERCCSGDTVAHLCYIVIFLLFLVAFPFFMKWMITAPVPQEFWNKKFDKFPLLEDWRFVQDKVGTGYRISMSRIPTTWSGCNHSCSKYQGRLRTTSEMNFKVDVKLEAPHFKHTAYPVLLASNDFDKWYVAADKRHAAPQDFFASDTSQHGYAYRHVTDKCTRPPRIADSGPVMSIEQYSSRPTYLMVCVTWSWEKVEWHRSNTEMTMEDLATYCDSVGGTCGWSCGASHKDDLDLPGCQAGQLTVSRDKVAGVEIPNASFSGDITVRPCMREPGSTKCTTSSEPMSRWLCHKCKNKTSEDVSLTYDSFPQLEVLLKNAQIDKNLEKAIQPHAFVLTSPLSPDGTGPDGMSAGIWKRLYEFDINPPPRPQDEPEEKKEELQEWEKDLLENGFITTTTEPPVYNMERHSMHLTQRNQLSLEPSWCYGRRGPLYLVACALNSSTYDHEFKEFKPGQAVAPPPFNDRCLVVSGRCAFACMENQPMMKYCEDGMIPQEWLDARDKKVESRKNNVFAVHAFILTLLFGFAVKMLAYFPGLFTPYKRAKYYVPEQTDQLRYIAVVTPSGGETKACVLRNLVGSVSTRPKDCKCSFHVLFADEGHRHQQKIMFRLLVAIANSIPDIRLDQYNPKRRGHGGHKAENLKTFMEQWVEDTKKLRLNDCNTDKMANRIKQLDPESVEAKKLQTMIDSLCGLRALQQMQESRAWPQGDAGELGGVSNPIRGLKDAILQMREELVIGEKKWNPKSPYLKDQKGHTAPKAMHLDDCENHTCTAPDGKTLLHLHYVARAKPDEDERTIKVQHVARGIWCYKLPKNEAKRNSKKWLDWRKSAKVYNYGKNGPSKYLVPIRTSRGKAGGLNFAENYLFDFCRDQEDARTSMTAVPHRYSLFSIADARHQFQPDFFHETMPYFFQRNYVEKKDTILNTRVAFTQCPQYFQEMPDDSDYLDTNNSNFFRLGCMLRNCCGGVSSCGTNGTWLVRDRRAGQYGTDCVWDLDHATKMEQGFSQAVERQFFHESCKVEDTASSLDRVVKGKYSQYINMRLSYGMAKEATDYLAAVQRWAEGGVVLSLQTFLGHDQGVHMIWAAFLLWVAFVLSLVFLVYGGNENIVGRLCRFFIGNDSMLDLGRKAADQVVMLMISENTLAYEWKADYHVMFFDTFLWLVLLAMLMLVVWIITLISWCCHNCSCRGRKGGRRTRFPTSLAQWARLFITVDNLTYFLWFWTAFFWVGFNYYGAYFKKGFDFDPEGMMILSWVLQVLSWSLIIASCVRYRIGQSMASNEVFFLTLTNIWRTTQMFYITAPLTLFSIVMGTADFLRNRSFGEDISYWVGGDRGAAAKNIVKYWTLLLVLGVPVTWICFFTGVMEEGTNAFPAVLVVTFIGLDAIHPCAYLWLGVGREVLIGLEEAPKIPGVCSQLAWTCRTWCLKLCSAAWYRNKLREVIFASTTAATIKWIGPVQHVLFPALSIFFPQLGVQAALNILAGLGR